MDRREYFVEMTTHVPEGTPEQTVDDTRAREAARAGQLAAAGHLKRLWRPPPAPGEWRTFWLSSSAPNRPNDRHSPGAGRARPRPHPPARGPPDPSAPQRARRRPSSLLRDRRTVRAPG